MNRSLQPTTYRTERQDRLRIACICFYLPPHDHIGAGYQMHYMANAYARHGHDVTMFTHYSEKAADALYEIRTVPVGATNRIVHFARNLRRQDFSKFDLIHAAGEDYWLFGKRRPFHIRTMHGSCFAEAVRIPGARAKLRMVLIGLTEVAASLVANRTVLVSHNTRRYMPHVRDVIWNGVDLDAFKPGPAKSPQPSILFVGTMQSRKRGAALLRAFQQEVLPAMPQAELWIVREEHPVEAPNVRWFGPVSRDRLVELYQQAWVFCLPSSYEGFGVPYIEAMACGTAVVATPNVGALEVLEKGKYGRITDLPNLGRTLLEILGDTPLRERMERAGLERATLFSWDRAVHSYLSRVPQ